jgi:hypothetical protein
VIRQGGAHRLSDKIPPMVRRPVLRFAFLLVVLAFLLPLAAAEGSCTDCLCGASADCCPPSCCACCLPIASDLTPVRVDVQAAAVAVVPGAQEGPVPSFDPRDIFHVPKTSPV